jgi:hypothetical protein
MTRPHRPTPDGVVLTVACVLALLPDVTGTVAHEWAGLAFCAVLVVHAARCWFVRRARGGAAIQLAILADVAVCMVSGLGISGTILPMAGLFVPDGYYLWEPVHAISAKILLVLTIYHLMYQYDKRHPSKARVARKGRAS